MTKDELEEMRKKVVHAEKLTRELERLNTSLTELLSAQEIKICFGNGGAEIPKERDLKTTLYGVDMEVTNLWHYQMIEILKGHIKRKEEELAQL
jgi:hypothetical protein